MIYSKEIFLKGLLGFGAVAAASYGGLSQKERIAGLFSGGETKAAAAITADVSKLLDEVGLECQGLENATAEVGVVCSKKTGEGVKNIKVKKEESTPFNLTSLTSSNDGKIKVYKDDGYDNKFKFVIEDGDIGDSTNKLEQFETYEIKEETNSSNPAEKQYYLNRKTKASDKIKVLLGLDTCNFPEGANATQPCNLTTEQIKKIKFEGKDGEVTGTGTLQISIAQSNETQDFPYGFKFTLTATSEGGISISRGTGKEALTLKNNVATIFNIKKSGSSLALEEALTKDALTGKVGLSCTGEGLSTTNGIQCSMETGENVKVKVKQESNTFELSSLGSSGKIKLYKAQDTEGYNKGLKFVIEDGNITESSSSNKLEEFETYEIKQDGTDWKLTRKTKVSDKIAKDLGLPDSCKLPEGTSGSKTCENVSTDTIKFEGKQGSATATGTLKIEIVTSSDEDFPHGYKFTLTPTSEDITIQRGSNESWTLKQNQATEFKLKKTNKTFTLEKAWTLETLTGKVGLSCTGSTPSETSGVECSKKAGSSDNIKVKKDTTNLNVSTISGGKIKVYKTSTGEDHNKGFKFVIEENDINGDSSQKLEQFETYEIKKESDGWKLVRKEDSKKGIKKALGLDSGCEFPTNTEEKECVLDDAKFKKINFENKGNVTETISGSPKLKISKVSGTENGDFGPFGYKFVLDSDTDAKISNSLTIKGKTNTEFKIKRQTNSNNITLEKAWTLKSLGDKVGLSCPENAESETNKECTLTDTKINVKNEESKKFSGLSKKNGGGGDEKKVKYAVGEPEYNQGFKFYVENEICLQNGSSDESSEEKKIEASSSTYQILKDSSDGKWYLTKKSNASRT